MAITMKLLEGVQAELKSTCLSRDEHVARLASAEKDLALTAKMLTRERVEVQETTKVLIAERDRSDAAEKGLAMASEQLAGLQGALQHKTRLLADMRARRREITSLVGALEGALEAERVRADTAAIVAARAEEELLSARSELQLTVASLQYEYARAESAESALASTEDLLEGLHSELRQTIEASTSRCETLKNGQVVLMETLGGVQAELEATQEELDNTQEQSEGVIKTLQSEAASLVASKSDLESKVAMCSLLFFIPMSYLCPKAEHGVLSAILYIFTFFS